MNPCCVTLKWGHSLELAKTVEGVETVAKRAIQKHRYRK